MITLKKDAIKYKDTTGQMKSTGMLCPVGIGSLVDPVDYLAAVCNRTITEIVNDKVTQITQSFQSGNTNLTKVDLPLLTDLPRLAFYQCSNLTEVNLPCITALTEGCIQGTKIIELYLPELVTNASNDYGYNFAYSHQLKKVILPKFAGTFKSSAFRSCSRLTTVILGGDTVCPLADTNVFKDTPIAGRTNLTNGELGYVYVKSALVEEYKSATNWSTYADQFRAIEDYLEICGGVV